MDKDSLPQLGTAGRILEGIVTTRNLDGTINIAPMGPLVDANLKQFILRPFCTSTTYENLARTSTGVLHITDDVLLIAQAAIGKVQPLPPFLSSEPLAIATACRWLKFELTEVEHSEDRSWMVARVTNQGHLRDFFGFNRAMHAVLEAAILATRVHLLRAEDLVGELERLAIPVQKTGAAAELQAYELLKSYVQSKLSIPQ